MKKETGTQRVLRLIRQANLAESQRKEYEKQFEKDGK
jgi:hypothetical protein